MNKKELDPMLAQWLREGPECGPREGLERALAATRSMSQRRAWTFVERWVPTHLTLTRVQVPRRAGLAVLVVALAVVLMLAATLAGSRPRVPLPVGPGVNGLLAFEAEGRIFVAGVDGSGRRQLSGDVQTARSPEFSPDGTKLAFVSRPSVDIPGGPLFVVPTDGSRLPIKVSGDLQVAAAYYPALAWSPDSRHIAFAANYKGVTSIVLAASDGSGIIAITDRDAKHDLPSWSPDGSLIAYRITEFDRSRRSLAIARADGSDERILTSMTGAQASLSIARWSPDGSRLVYHRLEPDNPRAMVVDLLGQETSIWPEQAWAYADNGISWSPDGRSVALLTDRDGVVIVDVDGGAARRLGPLAYCWIEWAPDGTAVYGPRGDRCGGPVNVIPIAHPELATTSMEGVLSWQRLTP